ncbi:YqcI/YcgG family protein [Lysinibacillus sp. NPDC048646]|uniref:YqcI/YcgG family protein n=1 Tax=Lysinibacillus sp. NPDC048646 TaxID=3390574 RepID=UPI003CFE6D8E
MLIKQEKMNTKFPSDYEWLTSETIKAQKIVEAKDFPCVFGTQGFKKKAHYIAALNYPYDPRELEQDIDNYLTEISQLEVDKAGLSGLLVFFQPIGEMSLQSKQFLAWDLLKKMKNIFEPNEPFNPLDDDFSFRFKQELWFINFSSNSYKNRKSRNLNSFLILALQTFNRSNEFFKENNTIKANAQRKVRNLALKFDGCPVHPGLGPIIGTEDEPTPMKLSYFIGDTNDKPSYQPWLFEPYLPERVFLDVNFDDLQNLQNFIHLEKNFELILFNESAHLPTLLKVDVKRIITNKDLHISKSPDIIQEFENVQTCCKVGTIANFDGFEIEHLNDLLALHVLTAKHIMQFT